MHKLLLAAAGVVALTAAPALAKDHGKGHGNGRGHDWHGDRDDDDWRGRGGRGCPPGLRDKGCLPPGQAKKLYGVGQRWPSAWGAYNLPGSYRSRYYDSRRAYYRYSDGYIYRIDPQTRLIQEIIRAVLR